MKIDEIIKANFQSPQHKVIVNVRYTSNFLGNLQNNFMVRHGITMPQFNILRILRGAKDSISVNTVKDRMVEKSPNTTRLMDKLIEKGLIERVRCKEDRRVVYVKITNSGLDLLSKIDEEFNVASLNNIDLTDAESEKLSELLDKLRNSYAAVHS